MPNLNAHSTPIDEKTAEQILRRMALIDMSPNATLDGKPATIAGISNRFATVRQLPAGLSVEFAWPTVERIILSSPTGAPAFKS